jgi:hypothetical protein
MLFPGLDVACPCFVSTLHEHAKTNTNTFIFVTTASGWTLRQYYLELKSIQNYIEDAAELSVHLG